MLQELKYGPYSNSRLDAALCPYRFDRCYIKKDAPEKGSEAANRGAAVHFAIESVINLILAHKVLPPAEEFVKAALKAHPVKLIETAKFVGEAIKLFHREPLRIIRPDKVVGVEEELAVDLQYQPVDYENPAAAIRGKADILMIDNDVGTLVDHKTQMHVGDDDAESFQMALYALLTLSTYPQLKEVQTIIHYAAPDLNFYSRPALWKREHLEEFKVFLEQRIAMAESIQPGSKVAYPGSYCQYCPVLIDCPMAAKLSKGNLATPGPIKNRSVAIEYAEAHAFMEEKRSLVQEHLRDYIKNIGPVPVGDSVIEMRTYGGRSYDNMQSIRACLKHHGLNEDAFLKIDSKTLSDYMDGPIITPEIKAELEALTYKKPTMKMGMFKQKKGAR